jgi:DNA-binding response OmpR family regulator
MGPDQPAACDVKGLQWVAHGRTVLVVDDDEGIVEVLYDFLAVDGFAVLTARDGAEALAIVSRSAVDCVLLDVMMPGLSGFDLCRQVRATSDVPILFLSARDGDSDKIRGLRLGGDDYVAKSATPDEVVARVHAVLRRARPRTGEPHELAMRDGILDYGRLVVDVRAHEVRIDGRPIGMPAREFALLRLLAEHPRQVFSHDRLFELAWGAYGDRSTVKTHVWRLREKIEEDPAHPGIIVTVWGVGYRFEGTRR